MVEDDGESGVAAGILGSGIPSRVYISRLQSKTFTTSALCLNQSLGDILVPRRWT